MGPEMIVILKKNSINLISAKADKTITKPIKAAVTVFLADSTPFGSPPAVIQRIPPMTKNIKAMMKARRRSSLIMNEIKAATVKSGSLPASAVPRSMFG